MMQILILLCQNKNWHIKPLHSNWRGYTICKRKNFMNLTSSEKLVFIASFMWLMNWGVRVSESIITHLL